MHQISRDAGLYFGDVHLNPEGLDDDDADRLNRYIQTYAEDPFEADSDAIREAIASLSDERLNSNSLHSKRALSQLKRQWSSTTASGRCSSLNWVPG